MKNRIFNRFTFTLIILVGIVTLPSLAELRPITPATPSKQVPKLPPKPNLVPKPSMPPAVPGNGSSLTPKPSTPSALKPSPGSHGTSGSLTPAVPGSRPTTGVNEATIKDMLMEDPQVKALIKRAEINPDSEAMKGIVQEHLFFESTKIGTDHNLASSGKFEMALAERLVGKDRLKDMKEPDIKDIQALTCPSQCGNPKFAVACRRTTRFLAAAKAAGILGTATVGTLYYRFMNGAPSNDEGKSIEIPKDDGTNLIVTDLDKPVAEETVPQTNESK